MWMSIFFFIKIHLNRSFFGKTFLDSPSGALTEDDSINQNCYDCCMKKAADDYLYDKTYEKSETYNQVVYLPRIDSSNLVRFS